MMLQGSSEVDMMLQGDPDTAEVDLASVLENIVEMLVEEVILSNNRQPSIAGTLLEVITELIINPVSALPSLLSRLFLIVRALCHPGNQWSHSRTIPRIFFTFFLMFAFKKFKIRSLAAMTSCIRSARRGADFKITNELRKKFVLRIS